MSHNIIETFNLSKKYGETYNVENVCMHVPQGQIYGLLGRNGAGKTTTMKMLLGLVTPTYGSINLFNTNPTKNSNIYRQVGSIIETPGFYENLTAFENLLLIQRLRNSSEEDSIHEVLKLVNLDKEKNKLFSNFSLGMKQRLGIAAAIVHHPKLLILDEPINGLDPIGISEIRSFLKELKTNSGITILISSHLLSEIEQIADIIGFMHNGKLIEEIGMKELHQRKQNFIECEVTNCQKAKEILTKYLKIKNVNISRNKITILEKSHDCWEINKILVENGIHVNSIMIHEDNLENYFSQLIGGKGIA